MDKNIKYSSFGNKFEIVYRNETPTKPMPPHTHNAIEIYLSLSSLPNVLLGDNVMPLDKNSLIIIPSYCIHQLTQLPDCEYERYIITIGTDWLENFTSGNNRYDYFTDSSGPIVLSLNDEQRKRIVNRIKDFLACGDHDLFAEMSIFFDVLNMVDNLSNEAVHENVKLNERHMTSTQKTVNQIIGYINSHLVENIRLTDIAQNFYLTPNHISRIFKKHTNTQISNYITLQRMTKAKQLFREGFTVSEVQVLTGYSSYEHFFRTFKKNVGVTPKEYINTRSALKTNKNSALFFHVPSE